MGWGVACPSHGICAFPNIEQYFDLVCHLAGMSLSCSTPKATLNAEDNWTEAELFVVVSGTNELQVILAMTSGGPEPGCPKPRTLNPSAGPPAQPLVN